jgi:hypothetical protein
MMREMRKKMADINMVVISLSGTISKALLYSGARKINRMERGRNHAEKMSHDLKISARRNRRIKEETKTDADINHTGNENSWCSPLHIRFSSG